MTKQLFLQSILKEFYTLAHTLVPNNYDALRFSHDGIDRSKEFQLGMHTAYLEYFIENWESFYTTFLLLHDSESRELFKRLILFRLLGHLHVRIKNDVTAETERRDLDMVKRFAIHDSDLKVSEMFGRLLHFEGIPFMGEKVKVDCWTRNVYSSFVNRQYFFKRGGVRVQPEKGDTCIDAGACFGDTAVSFAVAVGKMGKVYSFEPLPSYIAVCQRNVSQNRLADRIAIIPYALGNKTNHVRDLIKNDGGGSPGFSIAGREDVVPIISIDDFVCSQNVGKIDFIKMDIEGSELAALEGAKKTISRDRPKLAISLYHKPEDFITIPQYIKEEYPDYELYIDHYTIHAEETVLYAIAANNKP